MIEIQVVDARSEPGAIDAIVVEDDTFHVLGADPAWRPVTEHPLRVLSAAMRARPVALGSVVVEPGPPLRLYAVIHDLDAEPSCDVPAIAAALAEVLAIAERRGLRRLALPLLGTVHGRLPLADALKLLRAALVAAREAPLPQIELRVADEQLVVVRALLAAPAPP